MSNVEAGQVWRAADATLSLLRDQVADTTDRLARPGAPAEPADVAVAVMDSLDPAQVRLVCRALVFDLARGEFCLRTGPEE